MSELVSKVELQLIGKDVSASSTVDKVVERAEAKFERASRPRQYRTGAEAVDRSKLAADERASFEAEDIIAGRRLAEQDQRRRAMAENYALSISATEGGADAGAVHGPARGPRYDAREAAIRDAQASILREMRREARERETINEARRRLFGEEEKVGRKSLGQLVRDATGNGSLARTAQLLVGGGELELANRVGRSLEHVASALRAGAEDYTRGTATPAELVERGARSLPVLGGFIGAGRDVRGAIEELRLGRGYFADVERLQRGQEIANRVIELKRTTEPFDQAAGYVNRYAQARLASIDARFSQARLATLPTEERDRQQRRADLERANVGADATISQADVERQRRRAEIDAQLRKDTAGVSEADRRTITEKANRDREAAEQAYTDTVAKANQERRRARDQYDADELVAAKDQQRRLRDVVTVAAIARDASEEELRAARLQREGRYGEAEDAIILANAYKEQRDRELAFEHETEDLDRFSQEYLAKRQALSEQLGQIERKRDSDLETARQRRQREEEDTEQTHQERITGSFNAAAITRLRTAGRNLEADRAQIQEQLRARLAAINEARDKEIQAHRENADAIQRRAAEDTAAAIDSAQAASEALNNRRGGFDVNRGFAGSEGRLGARLTAAEVATPLRSDDLGTKVGSEFGKALKSANEKLVGELTGKLGRAFEEAMRRALNGVFATPGSGGA